MRLFVVPSRKVSEAPDGVSVVTSINNLDGDLEFDNGDGLTLLINGNNFTYAIDAAYVANQLTEGAGIDLSGTGPVVIRAKRALMLIFMDSGFTPSGTGADDNVQVVPHSPSDGTTVLTYNVRKLFFRVEATTGGESRIYPELYTGTGEFTGAVNMLHDLSPAYLSINGGGVYENSTTEFADDADTVQSGDKIRINASVVGAGHEGWYVSLLLEEV